MFLDDRSTSSSARDVSMWNPLLTVWQSFARGRAKCRCLISWRWRSWQRERGVPILATCAYAPARAAPRPPHRNGDGPPAQRCERARGGPRAALQQICSTGARPRSHSWRATYTPGRQSRSHATRVDHIALTRAPPVDLDALQRSSTSRGRQQDVHAHAAARSRVSSHLLLAQARARR